MLDVIANFQTRVRAGQIANRIAITAIFRHRRPSPFNFFAGALIGSRTITTSTLIGARICAALALQQFAGYLIQET
ncbi:hypothetical protein EB083_04925 [bacterium]|nr:hypothetical protein [bacterium]